MMFGRRPKRIRIEAPRTADTEDKTSDDPGIPPEEDGPVIDLEPTGSGTYGKRRWFRRDKVLMNTIDRMTWDGRAYIIHRTTEAVARNPRRAVHMTGTKAHVFVDLVDTSTRDDLRVVYDPRYKKPDAIDIHLYGINNDIDDALMIRQEFKRNVKKYIIWGMVACIAVCVIYAMIPI